MRTETLVGRKKSVVPERKPNGSIVDLTRELWHAAVQLRGSIEPADYKRYVLPIIFLRFLSLRYEKRRAELEALIATPGSDYYGDTSTLESPDEYRAANTFIVPPEARWGRIASEVRGRDDVKVELDRVLKVVEDAYPERLRGLLPPIYGGSNIDAHDLRALIDLFSKDVFRNGHGEDVIGRVYEYFIGEFASSEGKRGGEFFTPASIVRTLVALLEPERGTVFDPCCGSGGMFVQSDKFTNHSGRLSFYGQESKDFTWRLCKMNLFIHGIDGNIQLGDSYFADHHATLKADYVIANPPFNDGSKGQQGWGADRIPDKDPRLGIEVTDKDGRKTKPTLSLRNANTMWILHFLHHLADGGAAGFVMATGELSNSELARLEVRRALIEQDYVDCIVQLSGQLFANTQIRCALWVLSKSRDGAKGHRRRTARSTPPRRCRSSVTTSTPTTSVRLHLSDMDIDAALAEAAQREQVEGSDLERRMSRWAALAELAGAEDRVAAVADDILQHYLDRSKELAGKAMIVCMTRKNCVRLYDALTALPGCPEVKVVMTGNLRADPREWSQHGHITS
jgi:type I restriction enzyme M protein